MFDVVIVGCGLSGIVAARKLAENGKKVLIFERRDHIGGNIFDEFDHDGFLVQRYGPHCFFTNDSSIRPYIERFVKTEDCFVECRTVINGKQYPMPFNFASVDLLYEKEYAEKLKRELQEYFKGKEIVSITDIINSDNDDISRYGNFIYENEYKLYSAKQWGRKIEEISPEIFKRVPVYLSYRNTYQFHAYQFLPVGGFSCLAKEMLNHEKIEVILNHEISQQNQMHFENDKVLIKIGDTYFNGPVLYTGELDALYSYKYGRLPYRSLEFIWKTLKICEFQETAIVAYPQADKITRVTEYKKLPLQKDGEKITKISIEIPVEYTASDPIGHEPYYPIKNQENDEQYGKYYKEAQKSDNLFLCGRLADYKYYNMDMVIRKSWEVAETILSYLK